jgi:FtsH-binding integral membrane protein
MILFGFVAMFIPFNSTIEIIYGVLGALIFSGYIHHEPQRAEQVRHPVGEVVLGLTCEERQGDEYPQCFLSGFTILEAYSISVATSFYDARVVVQALALTLGSQ